ncbi:hypothetical protein [Luteimonas sp. J29]|jgi:hypothetical protein|uniref:hypothetical protein n=1 Tax=Luteimonas sp. J29 TaxID=935863 RepID=UPI0004B28B35|nr:hypothetical protein [Luteimonas sp. J29]
MARTASGPGSTHSAARIACVLLLAALAGACGERAGDQSTHSGDDVEPLPAPAQVQGSVTGMPGKPGPGEVPLSGDPPPPPPRPEGIAMDLERLEDNPETGLATPATGDAAQVVRDYYAALAARDHARAYAAWSDGGRASGLDPAGFAASFDDVIGIEATVGEPEPVADADGARQAEVPVMVTLVRADGSRRRMAGRFLLRAGSAGGEAAAGAWRIVSADLREAASP